MNKFILKGDIVYTPEPEHFKTMENGYVLCEQGICQGVYPSLEQLPDPSWKEAPIYDYTGKLIIPGITDLHMHAPQYTFRAMGLDLPLLDWLNAYTFPQEEKYASLNFAEKAYTAFVSDLRKSCITRSVLFGTIHVESDLLLGELLEKTGMKVLLGKVNMNRNSPESLTETTKKSILDTETFIQKVSKMKNVKPIITPRFVPSCDEELMEGLGDLAKKYNVPIQSHLNENLAEIAMVANLHPDCATYTSVYKKYGLLNEKTVMAHCVHLEKEAITQLKESGTYIAHCPQSNINISSGIAPSVDYLEAGMKMGLGSDIAGGTSLSLFTAAKDAIQVSKMRSFFLEKQRVLSVPEAFYLMTKGGGQIWAEKNTCDNSYPVGSFEKDYSFDAVVIEDMGLSVLDDISLEQRAERILYLADDRHIAAKFVNGEIAYEKP